MVVAVLIWGPGSSVIVRHGGEGELAVKQLAFAIQIRVYMEEHV